jgi:hypothetical protein
MSGQAGALTDFERSIGAQPQEAPAGAAPTSGSDQLTPRSPATAPVATAGAASSVAPPAAGNLTDEHRRASHISPLTPFERSLGGEAPVEQQAPLDPGGFGPYHESESLLFHGPKHKAFNEGIAKVMGFRSPADGILDIIGDTYDNLAGLGPEFTRRAEAAQKRAEAGGPMEPALPGWLQPGNAGAASMGEMAFDMGKQTLSNARDVANELAAAIDPTLGQPSAASWGGRGEHLSRALGGLIGLIAQFGALREGGDAGEGAAAKLGKVAEEHAPRPGNALLHTPPKTLLLGKDPGSFFSDPRVPIKVPATPTRLGALQNLREQTGAATENLHQQINALVKSMDTTAGHAPDGAPIRIRNLLDPYTEIENAAEEVKRGLQTQKGLGKGEAQAIVKEINAVRDDMLNDRDIEGNIVKTYPRQGMTPSEVNELKKSIGGRANYTKVFADPKEATKAAVVDKFVKTAYRRLKDQVNDAVPGAPGKTVSELNELYSNGIEARKLLDFQIAKESGTGGMNKFARKAEWMGAAGLIGSMQPHLQALGAIEAMIHAGRTVQGRIIRARGYAAAGRALQSPAGRAAASTAGAAAGAVPAVSGAARRTLAGEAAPQ